MPSPRSRRFINIIMYEAAFTLTLLAIEFLDEAASSHVRSGVFGAREAAWPLIRTDLGLSYAQVGLLLGLPSLVSSLVEPFLGILGDIGRRRVLIIILGGGVVFALALLGLVGLLKYGLVFDPPGAVVLGHAGAERHGDDSGERVRIGGRTCPAGVRAGSRAI